MPFCHLDSIAQNVPTKTLDLSKVATSQEELTVAMERVGENFDLARLMTANEFTLRDLRIRVAASKLSRAGELAQELDKLSKLTRKTAK